MAAASSFSSYRSLDVALISAEDVKDVNLVTKLQVYAVAMLSGDRRTKQRTPTDRDGRRNPTWNCPLRFQLPADAGRLSLDIYLRCERAMGDRHVGEVHVPIRELESGSCSGGRDGKSANFASYQIRRASGKAKGVLHFSYKLGDVVSAPAPMAQVAAQADEPALAYPAGRTAHQPVPYPPPPYNQPPWSQGYGHGYAAPQAGGHGAFGHGAPALPTYGYGAPPRKSKVGFGTGLLGGALGGLLIGDVLSDASAYTAGYEAGFDDGGDIGCNFDF